MATRDESDRRQCLHRLDRMPGFADVSRWIERSLDPTAPADGLNHAKILDRLAGEDPLGAAALALLDARAAVDAARLEEIPGADSPWLYLVMALDIAERTGATVAHASFSLDAGRYGLGRLTRMQCLKHLAKAVQELEPWREASPALALLHTEAGRHLRSLGGSLTATPWR